MTEPKKPNPKPVRTIRAGFLMRPDSPFDPHLSRLQSPGMTSLPALTASLQQIHELLRPIEHTVRMDDNPELHDEQQRFELQEDLFNALDIIGRCIGRVQKLATTAAR